MKESVNAKVFAKNLQHYVKLSGKPRKAIAADLHVTEATFSYWLAGKKYPRPEKISALAEFFHIQMSDLIDDKPISKVDPQTIEARIISVGVDKMTPENREKALNMMRIMFADIYDNIDNGSDDDDT